MLRFQFTSRRNAGIRTVDRFETPPRIDAELDATVLPPLSLTSYDDLPETLTPRTLALIETIRRDEPASINEAARVVDRDVKNVHEELSRLARLDIIYFKEDGQRKRPVVWFDDLLTNLPFDPENTDTAPAPL